MKERIDTACDERDKAEEEVATIGRRRAREIEELKDRLRDAERGLRRADEARELAEKELGGLKDSKARMEEILERERRELGDTKKAMSSMTSALDDTDGQVREIERQKMELRRRAEHAESKYEKLQKQHRVRFQVFLIVMSTCTRLTNGCPFRPFRMKSVQSKLYGQKQLIPKEGPDRGHQWILHDLRDQCLQNLGHLAQEWIWCI
jgi:DNA repair exonuclease SbcCD ATPase subunit